jgi:alpha-tubulin suppressor-like RCC1 family protein/putative cell wall-binding protein
MFTSFRRSTAIAGALAVFVALITTAASPGFAATPDEAPAIQLTSTNGRLAGADRYATAVEIAREVGNGSLNRLDRLILVTGEAFPDGLTASGLAGHLDTGGTNGRTAILLTRTESLPAVTADAIRASSVPASQIVIVGGPSAVSVDVHAAIARAAGWNGAGTNPVARVYGQTRYETASAVAEFVQQQAGAGLANSYRTVLVANGVDFPDALAAGGWAYRNGHLILLSRPTTSPTTTLTSITDLSATCAVLLGGADALAPTVGTQVTTALTPGGCGVDRVGGSNRYGTAALIAERFTRVNGSPRSAILVSGTEFADALTAAPLAGNRRPILLTGPNGLPPETSNWLTTNAATLDNIAVIGGTDAIPNSSAATANTAIIDTAIIDNGSGTGGDGVGGGGNTPEGLVAISSGYNHSCQILDGSVSCWGGNSSGQLGIGSYTTSLVPVQVVNGTTGFQNSAVTAVASGYEHTCAIEDGSVYCWGYNGYGQIGNGDNSFGQGPSAPVKVLSAGEFTNSDVTAIATGDDHTCAIEAGSVYCWGSQAYGALGNGGALSNFTPQSTPVKVVNGTTFQNSNVTAIAAGDEFTCAIQAGSAHCWGDNNDGKLGAGPGSSSSTPVTVGSVGDFTNSNVTAISAGFYHACVIQAGVAYCWGANFSGNLGDGTTNASTTPVKVVDGTDGFTNSGVTTIDTGTAHTCAIQGENDVLYCWGGNDDGRLGNGTNTNNPTPVAVKDVDEGFTNTDVIVVTTGHVFTCAIQGESAYCWGANWQGFLGDATTVDSNVPVLVSGVGDA